MGPWPLKNKKNFSKKHLTRAERRGIVCEELVLTNRKNKGGETMTLMEARLGESYSIREICTEDEELEAFLFSLGCYSGEAITVVSRKRSGCVVSIKNGRYNIDNQLAEAILI